MSQTPNAKTLLFPVRERMQGRQMENLVTSETRARVILFRCCNVFQFFVQLRCKKNGMHLIYICIAKSTMHLQSHTHMLLIRKTEKQSGLYV